MQDGPALDSPTAETFTKPNKQSTVSNFSSPVVQDTEDLSTERDERWRGGGTDGHWGKEPACQAVMKATCSSWPTPLWDNTQTGHSSSSPAAIGIPLNLEGRAVTVDPLWWCEGTGGQGLRATLASPRERVNVLLIGAVSPWACERGRGDGVGQVWSSPQGGSPLTLFRRGTRVPPATQYFQHTALGGCLLLPTMKPIAGVSLGRKAPWSADCYPEVFHRFLPSLPPALTQKERKNSITEQIQGEQCSLECILTRNKQCQHLWGADG
ncbi:hypothetical protein NQZ68_004540 [Dissostichus eleginoides]|nr:hypothetical protein NQZ68_004540 [Dissostichus eleginoides]